MRLRRVGISLVALMFAASPGLFSAIPARAAPGAPVVYGVASGLSGAQASQAVMEAGPPTEGAKVTLDDTSIDGPALWTIPGTPPSGVSRSVLAWTGTDDAHRLNYMTSEDSLKYGNKHTLDETSFARPSVTEQVDYEGGPQFIVLAWTGTDQQHTLNVLFIDAHTNQPVTKLTLWGETSFAAPAIAAHCCAAAGEFKLAWAGTDSQHTLNVITISPDRKVTGKTTLWGISTQDAPYLNNATPIFASWLLSWVDPQSRINFAQLPVGGGTWETQPAVDEWSLVGPSMIDGGSFAVSEPRYWLAWSGTDPEHHLNARFTTSFPTWPTDNTKTTFAETCLGAPELGFMRLGGPYSGARAQPIVAWTGTDPAHRLNVAALSA